MKAEGPARLIDLRTEDTSDYNKQNPNCNASLLLWIKMVK